MFDRFDNDDGVIHHQTDGQHQTEQRQRIDRKAQYREQHKRADQRYRHRQQRNQGRTPALQEQEHHDDDQHQRLEQGMHDLVDAFGDGQRGVQGDDVIQVIGEAGLQFRHDLLRAVGGFDGVGAGQLVQRHQGRWLAVQTSHHVIGLCAEFDAAYVLDTHDGARRVGSQHDVAEFLLGL